MKTILATHNAPAPHWVGDGFPVRFALQEDSDVFAVTSYTTLTQQQ